MAKAKSAVPEGMHTVTPMLTLDNGAQTIEWYKNYLEPACKTYTLPVGRAARSA